MPKRFIDSNTKICTICLTPMPTSNFYVRSDKKHLLHSRCKKCVCIANKRSSELHKERHVTQQKKYHQKNRDKRVAYAKKYHKTIYKEIRRERDKIRRKEDVTFRLSHNIRTRIRMALKRNSKSSNTNKLIGCDIPFLKTYIASLFTEGMTWDNYGEWQIDHIKPCSKFDLSKKDEQLLCFNFKNLQPLWALDNLIKKNKFKEKEVCHR